MRGFFGCVLTFDHVCVRVCVCMAVWLQNLLPLYLAGDGVEEKQSKGVPKPGDRGVMFWGSFSFS